MEVLSIVVATVALALAVRNTVAKPPVITVNVPEQEKPEVVYNHTCHHEVMEIDYGRLEKMLVVHREDPPPPYLIWCGHAPMTPEDSHYDNKVTLGNGTEGRQYPYPLVEED